MPFLKHQQQGYRLFQYQLNPHYLHNYLNPHPLKNLTLSHLLLQQNLIENLSKLKKQEKSSLKNSARASTNGLSRVLLSELEIRKPAAGA